MILDYIIGKANFWAAILLIMIGLYAMVIKKNLIKKLVGMNLLQTAIILFFVSLSTKKGATIPILAEGLHEKSINVLQYINPLPHVLMLTAIVVMVSTTGVALGIVILIYKRYGTLEEDEIIEARK